MSIDDVTRSGLVPEPDATTVPETGIANALAHGIAHGRRLGNRRRTLVKAKDA